LIQPSDDVKVQKREEFYMMTITKHDHNYIAAVTFACVQSSSKIFGY